MRGTAAPPVCLIGSYRRRHTYTASLATMRTLDIIWLVWLIILTLALAYIGAPRRR